MNGRQKFGLAVPSFVFLCSLLASCTRDKGKATIGFEFSDPVTYPGEIWQDRQTGLAWSFSFLGASLPEGSLPKILSRSSSGNLLFNPEEAGFNEQALNAVYRVLNELKESEEYRVTGSIDIGRFLMLTVYSSFHYYAITGAEPTLQAFKSKFAKPGDLQFVATNSTISTGDRLITFHIDADAGKMYFMAEEGTGSVADGTFQPHGAEVITVMPNGQPRFALYDDHGNLTDAADSSRSAAGKPGKCMWCHESNILPLYTLHTPVTGYLTPAEYSAYVDTARGYLEEYRKQVRGEIDFTRLQDHTFSEHIYTAFMEPSAYRLSQEWGISEVEAQQILGGLPVHPNPEFPFINQLYHRKDVVSKAPFGSLPVPESVREKSAYEPDLFGIRK